MYSSSVLSQGCIQGARSKRQQHGMEEVRGPEKHVFHFITQPRTDGINAAVLQTRLDGFII